MTTNNTLPDLNTVTLRGSLAAPIELETYPTGAVRARLLVTIRTSDPVRRVDVLPVTVWEPVNHPGLDLDAPLGATVNVTATIRRNFWAAEDSRRSRLELVADTITTTHDDGGQR